MIMMPYRSPRSSPQLTGLGRLLAPHRRPYDLRHAGVSLALNAGVPATEVARRAGHSVTVLLKIYAHCIDGQADAANKRITDALGCDDISDGQDQDGQAP